MIIIVFVGFLVFLYCMYFIKNPYFSLNKIKIKRSRYLLISELSMGGIIFFYTLFSGYSKIFKFLLQLGMVTIAKQDFYSVLPVFFMMLCMVIFVYFRN